MKVGIPREIKAQEHRVAITPAGVRELVDAGHRVIVERGAGSGAGIADREYVDQGASPAGDAGAVFAAADLIVKVKEPQPTEVAMLRPGQLLFTYLHLAADRRLTEGLIGSGATCFAYETVTDEQGRLPLLAPMSRVAGRLAAQAGANALSREGGGRGVLIGGIPGVPPAVVVVVGGGVVGASAASVAAGMGAQVHVVDRDPVRLGDLAERLEGRVITHQASTLVLEQLLPATDILIGAVLVAGDRAPAILRRQDLGGMQPGSVLVDVAIDQGGCFETSRPTTHASPTFLLDGVVHYCVANMPGAVPVTATRALTNATLPYVHALADHGVRVVGGHAGLAAGLVVHAGRLTSETVARAFGIEWHVAQVAVGGD